jgi:very-short-patch-repair endonuclease
MLLTNEVNIKVSRRYIKYYESLGFKNIKQGDLITIPINLLSKGSSLLVDVECDCCKIIKKVSYINYNKRKRPEYLCKKCSIINNNMMLVNKNTIHTICDYCGGEVIVKKSEYNRNIKNNGKFSCKKCGPNKYRETCLEKYGVDNITKLCETHDKIKNKCLEKHGDKNFRNIEKTKETKLQKYGKKYSSIVEKIKQSCLKKFGVENASQNPEVFSKQQKRRYEIRNYNNSELFYQGSYEKDFLDKYYNKIEIKKIEPISYRYENKNKKYFPDFYLPDYNLIVEIKSSYIYEKHKKQNLCKRKACINNGYNYIFIINKNYSKFNKIII